MENKNKNNSSNVFGLWPQTKSSYDLNFFSLATTSAAQCLCNKLASQKTQSYHGNQVKLVNPGRGLSNKTLRIPFFMEKENN